MQMVEVGTWFVSDGRLWVGTQGHTGRGKGLHFMMSGREGRRAALRGRDWERGRTSDAVPTLSGATRAPRAVHGQPHHPGAERGRQHRVGAQAHRHRRRRRGAPRRRPVARRHRRDRQGDDGRHRDGQRARPGKGAALRPASRPPRATSSSCSTPTAAWTRPRSCTFIDAVRSGYDFVKGSRHLPDAGSEDLTWLRSFGNKALGTAVNVLYGTKFTDLCYGFMAFRRDCLDDAEPQRRRLRDRDADGRERGQGRACGSPRFRATS